MPNDTSSSIWTAPDAYWRHYTGLEEIYWFSQWQVTIQADRPGDPGMRLQRLEPDQIATGTVYSGRRVQRLVRRTRGLRR